MTGAAWFLAGTCCGVASMLAVLHVVVADNCRLATRNVRLAQMIVDMGPDYDRGRNRRLANNRHNRKRRA